MHEKKLIGLCTFFVNEIEIMKLEIILSKHQVFPVLLF